MQPAQFKQGMNTTQRWVTVGDQRHFFRSEWEIRYAFFLEYLKQNGQLKEWEYEPKTFWFDEIKRGTKSYKPDFFVQHMDGSTEWHEVKGYLDGKSKTKLKRFQKYFPQEKLVY